MLKIVYLGGERCQKFGDDSTSEASEFTQDSDQDRCIYLIILPPKFKIIAQGF